MTAIFKLECIHDCSFYCSSSATQTSSSIVLPYINGLSEAVRRILAPFHVRTNFRPAHTLRKGLVCVKDSIPHEQKSGVVYYIPCSTCPKTYIGQTSRSFLQRVKEHRRALATGNCLTSAAAEHAITTNHSINCAGPSHSHRPNLHSLLGLNDQNSSRKRSETNWNL